MEYKRLFIFSIIFITFMFSLSSIAKTEEPEGIENDKETTESVVRNGRFVSTESIQGILDDIENEKKKLEIEKRKIDEEKAKVESLKDEIDTKLQKVAKYYEKINEILLAIEIKKESKKEKAKKEEELAIKKEEIERIEKLTKLVRFHSRMKEKDSAKIISNMDVKIAADIFFLMKAQKASKILSYVDNEKAAEICEILASKKKQ